MRKAFLIYAFLFFCVPVCSAGLPYHVADNNPLDYVVTGTIEKLTTNAIDIRDEDDKVLKRYVYFGTDVVVGDRVRAHYDPVSMRIDLLKKMTRVEYKKNGQNLGYTTKNE